jgi:hypothetical protein
MAKTGMADLKKKKNKKLPFVIIVADDAFPITNRIMKPYPKRGLSYSQKIFNYRLSRARLNE